MKSLLLVGTLGLAIVAFLPSTTNAGSDFSSDYNCIKVQLEPKPPQLVGLRSLVPGPMICAWATVGWTYFEGSVCEQAAVVDQGKDVMSPQTSEAKVCAAPYGSGGGGSNGGQGTAVFDQDIGRGPGSCTWGDPLSLIAWDECTASFEHGDPHFHTAAQCHAVHTTVTNTLWVGLTATAESCPIVPDKT